MFQAFTRIAVALERLTSTQEELVATQVEHTRAVQQQTAVFLNTQDTIRSLNAALQQSNDRATWYHQEASQLRAQMQHLEARVRGLSVYQ